MNPEPAPLSERLKAIRLAFESGPTPAEDIRVLNDHVRGLMEGGIVERAIQVGSVAPPFTMKSTCGKALTLGELLPNGPVVLTWFRGNW